MTFSRILVYKIRGLDLELIFEKRSNKYHNSTQHYFLTQSVFSRLAGFV